MVNGVFGSQGLTLGKYRLIAELGHGGMSDVFLAIVQGAAGFEKLVVLKVLRPNLAEDPEFLSLFVKEARLSARVSHRNVVQTYEVGQEHGYHYIVMEYLEGQPFKRVLEKARISKDQRICIRVLADALAGLHHAHELRSEDGALLEVVHRDVSPHNMFVTYEGLSKVVDFGIAKALDASTETSAGVMKGKLAYVAPEQAASKRVDRRADIFSAGVILYHIVSGKRMWQGLRAGRISRRLLSGDIPKLEYKNGFDRHLVRIVNRALEPLPQDRFHTADLFREELIAYLEQTGGVPDERHVGMWMNELFRDDRVLMEAIVRRQFSRLRQGETRGAIEIARLISPARSVDATFPGRQRDENSDAREQTASLHRSSDHSLSASRSYSASRSASREKIRKNLGSLGLASLLLVGLLLSLVWFWGYTSNEAVRPPAPEFHSSRETRHAHLASSVDARSKPGAPRHVSIWISSMPRSASLQIDGKPVASNPFHASVVADKKPHWLRVVLDGYQPEVRELRFTKDVRLEMVLRRLPSSRKPHVVPGQVSSGKTASDAGSRVPTSSSVVTSGADAGNVETKRPTQQPLDTENPWLP